MPIVVDAVAASTRLRARRATGWPVTAWLSRLKPDPLKRLHLDLGKEGRALTRRRGPRCRRRPRSSGPGSTPRCGAVADDVGTRLTRPWQDAVRRASVSHLDDISDRLDQTLAGTDLGVARLPWWAGAGARAAVAADPGGRRAGAVWLGSLAVMGYLQVPQPSLPSVFGIPVPTLMLIGGVGLGILLGLFCRVLVHFTARSRARAVDKRLRSGIRSVVTDMVIKPIDEELDAYNAVRHGLNDALR